MSLVFMVVGTVAWYWKGNIELALILMLWAIFFEITATNYKLIPKIVKLFKKD